MDTKRFIFGLAAIFILVSIIYPHISPKKSFPCANDKSCQESLQLKIENNAVGIFNNRKVIPPKIYLSLKDMMPSVLGIETAQGEKHIYVDLTSQTLLAYQGNILFMQTYISSGKWYPTPTGDFTIWSKVRSTRMTGGEGADFYDLPNVPYVMFFENSEVTGSRGFSLHGTYWHDNFGHPMSHGCVNMRIVDAEKLYDWANPLTKGLVTTADEKNQGTKVTIYGLAPS